MDEVCLSSCGAYGRLANEHRVLLYPMLMNGEQVAADLRIEILNAVMTDAGCT